MTDVAFDSWLGHLPSHWIRARFGQDVVINEGQVDPTKEPWSSMVLVAPNHIESGTGRIISLETARDQGADSGKYRAKSGQVHNPYTRALLEARPTPGAPRGVRLKTIPGSPPHHREVGPGCPFAGRCEMTADVCRTTRPPPAAFGAGHVSRCWRAEHLEPRR